MQEENDALSATMRLMQVPGSATDPGSASDPTALPTVGCYGVPVPEHTPETFDQAPRPSAGGSGSEGLSEENVLVQENFIRKSFHLNNFWQ